MRRSAAPSSQSAAKRLRFLSPFVNPSFEIDENDFFDIPNSKCSNAVNEFAPKKLEDTTSTTRKDITNCSVRSTDEVLKFLFEPTTEDSESIVEEHIPSPIASSEKRVSNLHKDKVTDSVRSTDEILKYLFEPLTDTDLSTAKEEHSLSKNACNFGPLTKSTNVVNRKSLVVGGKRELQKPACDQDADSADSDPGICYYNVLYCKRSAKKHKVWESDGVLIIKNRSAVLKNSLGKIIDRGIGYKLKEIEAIEDGSKFFIGGKECEIQFQIPPEEYKNLEISEPPETDVLVPSKSYKKPDICM